MPKLAVLLFSLLPSLLLAPSAQAQIDEDELGAWYIYQWTKNPQAGQQLGFQGDIQYRNWDLLGDLEQLLIRGGATWQPEGSAWKFTAGVAHITSGQYGPPSNRSEELRLYQEALLPQRVGERLFFSQRFRLEQRWIDGQDFRNRLRWSLGLNLPFNQPTLSRGALYLALYNELFLNLERGIGQGRHVDWFDRNRAYAALGYSAADNLRLQFGYMLQETKALSKGQLQFNLVHNF